MATNWLLNENHRENFEIVGSKVTFKYDPDQCTNYNAMYLELCACEKGKKYYWEFTCGSSCSVGVASKDAFADGYKISGAFFNGNLSNGSYLLEGEFGDPIREGDRIGMILDLGDQELKIYITQNDRSLGLAYVQSAPYSCKLHPVVSFSSSGSVEIKEKDASNVATLLTRSDYPHKTIDGKYQLLKTIEKNAEKKLPEYVMTLRGDGKNNDKIRLSLRVTNTVGCTITKMGKNDAGEDLLSVEGLMSTMMAGPPEEMQNEFFLTSVIHGLKGLKFSENFDEVSIESAETTLYFKRFLPPKTAHQASTLLK